jgi:hypothetical protein
MVIILFGVRESTFCARPVGKTGWHIRRSDVDFSRVKKGLGHLLRASPKGIAPIGVTDKSTRSVKPGQTQSHQKNAKTPTFVRLSLTKTFNSHHTLFQSMMLGKFSSRLAEMEP